MKRLDGKRVVVTAAAQGIGTINIVDGGWANA